MVKRFVVKTDFNDDLLSVYDNETMMYIVHFPLDDKSSADDTCDYLNSLTSELENAEKKINDLKQYIGKDKHSVMLENIRLKGMIEYQKGLYDLEVKYFNTGSIYRCIALEIINNNLDVHEIRSVIEHLKLIDIDFNADKVFLSGIDVTDEIRTEIISVKSTEWATIPEIKELVRKIQKEYTNKNLVDLLYWFGEEIKDLYFQFVK